MRNNNKRRLTALVVGVGVLLVAELAYRQLRTPSLADIVAGGELVVLTRNAPTQFYQGREGPEGFEHDLARSFAADLGVVIRYVIKDSVAAILRAIREGQGHLAAAGLTRTEDRQRSYLFGPDYHHVQQQVVCRRGGPRPASPEDLPAVSLTVIADSSYAETLTRLQGRLPDLRWKADPEADTEELLERVWRREVECTVADSNIVAINRRYYPELEVAFSLSAEEPLAWVVADHAQSLLPALDDWFARIRANGTYTAIDERYYGHVTDFDYVNVRVFMRHIKGRLPRFKALFQESAERHGLSWTLLAAMAYQESRWNPRAKSPTGVRGLMMLTRRTAKELNVKNRLDPAQSVRGGALYLARLLKRLPESVVGEDRLWFALAAYNVGMGHLYDARKLATRLSGNPDVWFGLKDTLPLLARKKYYKTLRYGYARGSEPVNYVRRIRDFQDMLEQHLARLDRGANPTPPLTQAQE